MLLYDVERLFLQVNQCPIQCTDSDWLDQWDDHMTHCQLQTKERVRYIKLNNYLFVKCLVISVAISNSLGLKGLVNEMHCCPS